MKIAIIGDYHISTRWIGELSIAEQSEMLADRLVEYCRSRDIKYLFIAGDIIDKAIDRPEILHTVNHIFKKFSGYFTQVYYILGQHDMAVNPVGEINEVDSLINVLDYPNIQYAHRMILDMDGSKIGLSNFSRNSSYKLPEYVDLYITHFTISQRFGQTIDQSKFGMMIAGDIHHKVDIGNMHSIGSFQQQSVSKDSEWNNVCVYDTQSHTYEHDNIGGGRILRNSEVHSGLVDGVWYELKRTPQVTESLPIVDKFKDDNYLKIIQQVSEFMKEKELEDMNAEVASQIDDVHNFSTEFNIRSLKVYNFLKIHQVEMNFEVGDKVLLTGPNGSGKSTFLNALFSALTGNVTWSHLIGAFDSEVWTEIELTYLGTNYTLRRGSGLQWLKCGDSEVPYKNRNDFNSVVNSKLPFLPELGILFQRPEVGTFFEGINSDTKLSLVSKVYHLEYLDQLYSTGERIKQGYVKKLNELGYNIKVLNDRKDKLNTKKSELVEYKDVTIDDVTALKCRLDELIKRQSDSQTYAEVLKKVTELKSEIKANEDLIAESNKTISSLDKSKYEITKSHYEKLTKDKSELEQLIKHKAELISIAGRYNTEIKSLEENKCPRCNQTWVTDEAKTELSNLRIKLTDLNSDLNATEVKIDALNLSKAKFDMIPVYKAEMDTYNTTQSACAETIRKCNAKVTEKNAEIAKYKLPEKVEFTSDDLQELLAGQERSTKIAEYLDISRDLKEVETSLGNQTTERDDTQKKVDELGLYNWYVCKSGPIYRSILESLCETWSNDYVKFSIFDGIYRGNAYLDIKISYLKGSNWQDYSASSSGEKSYMDILFIKSVTANAGFLILDEFLRHMDNRLTDLAIDEIKQMNVGLFILSSFNPNLYFANRTVQTKFNPQTEECEVHVD